MAKSVSATLKDILAREEKLLASIKKTVSLVAQKQSQAALKEISKMKANAIKSYKEADQVSCACTCQEEGGS